MYQLTEEGKEYLEKGLPEKRLLKFLIDGRKKIEDVASLPRSPIAVGWAKKNGWVKIEHQKFTKEYFIELSQRGKDIIDKKTQLEIALEDIQNKGTTDKESLKILLNRGLIEETKTVKIEKFEPKIQKIGLLERILKFFRKKVLKKEPEIIKEKIISEIAHISPDILKSGEWKEKQFKKYDINAPAPRIYLGKKHPYIQFVDDVKERLIGLGFQQIQGPLVELFFWNCDALFMPQDHPGRGIHDIFNLKNPSIGKLPDKNLIAKVKATHEGGWVTGSIGWGGLWDEKEAAKLLMRSHGTAVSARTLFKHGDKPGKYFCIEKVFRPDIIDAKHLMEFYHCEGIVIGEDLTFRHLLGFLKEIAESIGIKEVKFKPCYFSFTEPSCEMYVNFPNIGWIETGGAGLMRPEVLRPLGIEKSQVLAWGIGIDRLAMLKLGIDDIRMLYSDDLEWLRNKEMIKYVKII